MNKTELIAAAAEKAGLSKKDTEAVITATLASITEALQNDDKVQLVGFGSFEVKKRAARCSHLQGRQGSEGRRCEVRFYMVSVGVLRHTDLFMKGATFHASGQISEGFPAHQAPHRGQ